MLSKSPRPPKNTIQIKRLLKEGDEITIRAKVTALGRTRPAAGHDRRDPQGL